MKEELMTEVMQRMLPYLDNAQLKQLRQAMERTLCHYEVTGTQVKPEEDDSNDLIARAASIFVEKVPTSTEPAAPPEPSNSAVEEESLPAEAPTRETTDTSVSIAPPVQEHNNPDAVTADDLVGPWHLVEDEKDNATAMEAIPGAMEFGSSMEITSDGHISCYIGADGGIGTYSLSGNILSADMTNDFEGSSMKMEFTAEKTDGVLFLYTECKGLLLCWSQGEGETGKGGEDESETSYPGADVVELVNLRGDMTTVYNLADGTYMDRIERRFTYNGTDTWIDEDGAEWNAAAE